MALGLGLLSGSALLIGAVLGLLADWPTRLVAAIMGFGAGALISAMTFGLVAEAEKKAGFGPVAVGFLLGAIAFVLANQAVNAHGGFLRKPATLYHYLREKRRRHALAVLARLSQVDLLRALPPEDVQGLVPFVEARYYRAGQVIFERGHPGDALYLIESGTVEIERHGGEQPASTTPSDSSSVVSEGGGAGASAVLTAVFALGPGEAFGELALLAGQPHRGTAVAKSDAHLWRIRKDRLELLEERSPRLAAALEALRARHLAKALSTAATGDHVGGAVPLPAPARWRVEAERHLSRNQAALAAFTAAEHHEQVQAHAGGGAATAIFLGAMLDGIPESVVIGASLLHTGAFSPVFVIAVFLSNLPEALSSAAGMRHHGSRPARVLGLWGGLVVVSGLAALLGNVALAGAPGWLIAGAEALAAGGILAMLADTMMPEAFEHGGPFIAVWTALGFIAAFFVRSLGAG